MKSTPAAMIPAWALAFALAAPALADSGDIVVRDAWSRASVGVSRPGVAYMAILNPSDEPVTLTGLRTDLAERSEIHLTATDGQGVSSMTPAGDIAIAPGETVLLQPGGLHAMLMQLRRPMQDGESFALTLTFSDGGEATVEVPIMGIAARGPGG
ncbi:copper chaperone PCu(A)C [Palleronia rufa]|uniref:copper chaperone PCu(A)C n=1 Tax=Palleronia rufa TaxID=1530186 RepID=UPI00068E5686|nr:copper chaperone PCu(A)C [Palleronia rufa]